MLTTTLAIAPIFLMILLGYALRRGGIPSTDFWNINDRLVYWVLMPALFFVKISDADVFSGKVGLFASVLIFGFFASSLLGFYVGRAGGWSVPVRTSILQGSARFNTFVGLAVAEALYGAQGLETAVIGSALLVPVVNVTVVTAIVWMQAAGQGGIAGKALRDLLKNPLILSIGAGLIANRLGLSDVPVLTDTLQILGAAALPIMLLCVGANLRLRQMQAAIAPLAGASVVKLMAAPLIVAAAAVATGLDSEHARIVLIYMALPTGVASYTLARQMGGDAPLMAAIISVQTLLSFLTLPLAITLAAMVI